MATNTELNKRNTVLVNSKNIQGSFTAVGQSSSVGIGGNFTVSVSGFGTATVALQRSYDNGSTWHTIENYTADTERNGEEWGSGVDTNGNRTKMLYRLNCTAYTAGTIAYYLGG